MPEITAITILAAAIVVSIINRRRAAHLCTCGHRRDQHDDAWGDYCNHVVRGRIANGRNLREFCPCIHFERRKNR